jgi:hypothetical protein
MQVQAPTLPNRHRAQVVSALAALALAGATFGVVTIATNDDGGTQSQQAPVVSSRAMDGSPILRGTANRVDTGRVLDGSPILRGSHTGVNVAALRSANGVRGSGLGIAPLAATRSSALRPPAGQPEGFHGQ